MDVHDEHCNMEAQLEQRNMDVQDEHGEMNVQDQHRNMEVPAQLQVYFNEVIAANDDKRSALQALGEVRTALAREQQHSANMVYWYNHEHNKATQLSTDVQHLRAVVRQLNGEIVRLSNPLYGSAQDQAPLPHDGALNPVKRGLDETNGEMNDHSQHKRRHLSIAAADHLGSTPKPYAWQLEPKPKPLPLPLPMPVALTSFSSANNLNPQSSLPPSQVAVGHSVDPPALTIGVFVFNSANEVTVAALNTNTVPQTIIDAIYASIKLTQNREKILRSRAGTCMQCKFAGTSSSGLPTEIYRDPLTNQTIPEIACRYCTLEQRPCVRRSANIYDLVLAPLARQFRRSTTADLAELYITRTKPAVGAKGQFVKKKDMMYGNGWLV